MLEPSPGEAFPFGGYGGVYLNKNNLIWGHSTRPTGSDIAQLTLP